MSFPSPLLALSLFLAPKDEVDSAEDAIAFMHKADANAEEVKCEVEASSSAGQAFRCIAGEWVKLPTPVAFPLTLEESYRLNRQLYAMLGETLAERDIATAHLQALESRIARMNEQESRSVRMCEQSSEVGQ